MNQMISEELSEAVELEEQIIKDNYTTIKDSIKSK